MSGESVFEVYRLLLSRTPRYEKFAQEKNIQMLAMVSILLLKAYKPVISPRKSSASHMLLTLISYKARVLPPTPWLISLHLFGNRRMTGIPQFAHGKMVAANHPPGCTRHLPQSPIPHRYPSRPCPRAGHGPVFLTRATSGS